MNWSRSSYGFDSSKVAIGGGGPVGLDVDPLRCIPRSLALTDRMSYGNPLCPLYGCIGEYWCIKGGSIIDLSRKIRHENWQDMSTTGLCDISSDTMYLTKGEYIITKKHCDHQIWH